MGVYPMLLLSLDIVTRVFIRIGSKDRMIHFTTVPNRSIGNSQAHVNISFHNSHKLNIHVESPQNIV